MAGLFVLDIDPRHRGQESFYELQLDYGRLPEGLVQQLTGGDSPGPLQQDHPEGKAGPGPDRQADQRTARHPQLGDRSVSEMAGPGAQAPSEVLQATSDYLVEMDVVRQFLDECCSAGDEVQGSRLYEAFVSWCEDQGEKPLTQKRFGARLTAHGYESQKSSGSKPSQGKKSLDRAGSGQLIRAPDAGTGSRWEQ